MENSNVDNEKFMSLIREITQGKELVQELRNHLNPSSSTTGEFLIEKTLSSLEKALSMAIRTSSTRSSGELPQPIAIAGSSNVAMLESPHSVSGSPQSDDNDRPGFMSKKRKGMERWTEQIKVGPGMGLEGPVDDGYSWRKYGQKDILGAKYPRGYYRCTYRNVQGCLATKQVQRSDENPLILDITYRGRHTCIQAPHHLYQSKEDNPQYHRHQEQLQKPLNNSQEILLDFSSAGANFQVTKSETLEIPQQPASSFSFPSSTEISFSRADITEFDDSTNNYNGMGTSASASFSPPFISSVTSDHLTSFSPCQMSNNNNAARVEMNYDTFESDLNEIVSSSAATAVATTASALNSSGVDVNFALDALEFDPSFIFGGSTQGFLS